MASPQAGRELLLRIPRRYRPFAVVLYAAFIGLLLASYIAPIQDILSGHAEIPKLESRLNEAEAGVAAEKREAEALQTPEGIERAARERYGMILPGEKVYIIEENGEDENGE